MTEELLTAEDILTAEDLSHEDVEVPEWKKNGKPGVVRLWEMGADESIGFTEELDKPENKHLGMIIILVYCARNLDGQLLFTREHIAALRKKNFKVLDKLQRVALRLNKMGRFSEVALKKDSSVTEIAASPSVSRVN